jgi:NADH-quinone oxidoreductase subunit L
MAAAAWLVMLILGIPWAGALAAWLVGDRRPTARNSLAVGASVAAALASLALLPLATSTVVIRLPVGGAFGTFTFVPDGLAVFMTAIATVIGSLAVIFSLDYMRGEAGLARYYCLILVFIGSMAGLVLSGSLLLLLVFWEIVGLCSFGLIAFHADQPLAVAGGVRALVMTQLGSLGLLVGILAARAALGTDDMATLIVRAPYLPPITLAVIAYGFLVAACAKSAQVPFHTWLPGAMEAPTPISALIHAATMVNAGVYVLARFSSAFTPVAGWSTSVVAVGVTSALLGGVMALVSTDLKRALAYSTISQLGYLFYAIGVGAVFASQFHLLSHALFKALLFLAAGAVIHATGTRDFARLGGLGTRMPLVRNAFVVGALALVGVPILNGFWSKDLILEEALNGGSALTFAAMLLAAGLTAMYSFRLVWRVFYGPAVQHLRARDALPAMRVALVPLAAGSLLSWLAVGPLAALLAVGLALEPTGWAPLVAVLTTPGTIASLLAALLGAAAWWWRKRLAGLSHGFEWLYRAAHADFGFERLDREITHAAVATAGALRRTQTGHLNWNLAGLVAGLAVLLVTLGLVGGPRA